MRLPLFKSLSPPRAELLIELGKEEFDLGETLEGSVVLKCLEDFDVQSVNVDLVGRERVKGTLLDYSGDDQTRIYSPVNSLARTARPVEIELLMHSNPAPASGPFKASKDYSGRFQFRFFIPSHLGPSYQGGRQDGSWLQRTWAVKATVAVAGRPDLETIKEIRVSIPKPKAQEAAGVGLRIIDAVFEGVKIPEEARRFASGMGQQAMMMQYMKETASELKDSQGGGAAAAGLGAGVGLGMPFILAQQMGQAGAQMPQQVVICPSCGAKNPVNTKFCGNCGSSLMPPSKQACPSCKAEVPENFKFCPNCGTPIKKPEQPVCPKCGEKNPPGTKFCGNCGEKLA
ncbi:MAG: zinc ribbon domain-containing protein [Candidatus Verstraetearchaeota archaeon]|nr:zinc ribbon domain-containing protein [Candidatus Verstraetearchaeota archaeon]